MMSEIATLKTKLNLKNGQINDFKEELGLYSQKLAPLLYQEKEH